MQAFIQVSNFINIISKARYIIFIKLDDYFNIAKIYETIQDENNGRC